MKKNLKKIPTTSATGYSFIGWAASPEDAQNGKIAYFAGGEITARTENITLYAVWHKKQKVIRLYANGGGIDFLGIIRRGEEYLAFTAADSVNTKIFVNGHYKYVYDYHTFDNKFMYYKMINGNPIKVKVGTDWDCTGQLYWYTDKTKNTYYKQLASELVNNETVTFTANWKPVTYTVKLSNGSSKYDSYCDGGYMFAKGNEQVLYKGGSTLQDAEEMTATFDSTYIYISNAHIRGYSFKRYGISAGNYDSDHAKYYCAEEKKYKKIGTDKKLVFAEEDGMQAELTENGVSADFAVTNLSAGDKDEVKLTAVWSRNTYTITLDDNGGSGGDGAFFEYYEKNMRNAGKQAISSVTKPVKSGYVFTGYYICTVEADKISSYDTQVVDKDGKLIKDLSITENGYTYKIDDYNYFAEDTTLYAKWEEEKLEVEIVAQGEDSAGQPLNTACYYDYSGSLKERIEESYKGKYECDGYWYKDSVNIKITGYCNYADISENHLEIQSFGEDTRAGLQTVSFDTGENPYCYRHSIFGYDPIYLKVAYGDVFAEGYTESDSGTESKHINKVFCVDSSAPAVYNFSRRYDIDTKTYRVFFNSIDEQSGIVEIQYQKNENGSRSWSVIDTIDKRVYDEAYTEDVCIENGFYSSVNDKVAVNYEGISEAGYEDRNTKYRFAVYDALGHVSYTEEFSLISPLEFSAKLYKLDNTTVSAGETLELYKYGDMCAWIDSKTEGWADRVLYVLPKEAELYDETHREVSREELEDYPLDDGVKEKYLDNFEDYKFYAVDLVNDSDGKSTDNFCLHLPEDGLELNESYRVRAFAIRGDCDSIQKTFYIAYKNTSFKRVIISQSWQAPQRVRFHWDFLNYIFYGKSGEELWREHEIKYPRKLTPTPP